MARSRSRRESAQKRALAEQFFGLTPAGDGTLLANGKEAPPLRTNVGAQLAKLLQGHPVIVRKSTPDRDRVQRARALCRDGNPFALIGLQWPEFLVDDPAEAKYFGGELGNPDNPCLRIDYWQRDILSSFFDMRVREVFVKGCVGAGKGTASSLIFNLAYDVWDNCRIILTSTTHKHAKDTIFAEVVKWRLKMRYPLPGNVLGEGIFRTPQHQMMVSNPLQGEAFSGKHGEMIVFGFDEASGVPNTLYTQSLNQFHKIVALSNPRTQHGWFRGGFKPCRDPDETQTVQGQYGRRRCVTVSGLDCLNIKHERLETPVAPRGGIMVDGVFFEEGMDIAPELRPFIKPLIPNQSDLSRYRGLLGDPDPREIDVKAHGKFPSEDITKQVILGSWLPFHEYAHHNNLRVDAFGLDVAAFHDENVLTAGGRDGLLKIHRYRNPNALRDRKHTMKVVAWTIRVAKEEYGINLRQGRVPICVDMDGIGKGVGDRLEELGVWVIAFYGNAASEVAPRRYANLRAEAYGELGRRLDNHGPWGNTPWAIPVDDRLAEELCAPEKIYDSSGERFHLSPKSRQHGMSDKVVTVKEKIGRSPDTGDSTVYMFHAVRVLDLWSSSRAAIAGPLTVSPAPPGAPRPPPEKVRLIGEANGDVHADTNGHDSNGDAHVHAEYESNGAAEDDGEVPDYDLDQASPETQSLLDHLRQRYS